MLPAYFELKSCLVEHEQLVLPLPTNPAWPGNSRLGFPLHLELGSPDSEWQGLQHPQALVQVPEVTEGAERGGVGTQRGQVRGEGHQVLELAQCPPRAPGRGL